MSTLKDLDPMIRICQIIGLFPFRMELDPVTGQFVRFIFSWCHYVTWYFFALIFLQVGMGVIGFWGQKQFVSSNLFDSSFQQLPTSVLVLVGVSVFTYFLLLIVVKIVVFRYTHLSKAIELFRKLDQLLPEMSYNKNTIRKRTLIGCIITVILVIGVDITHF